MENYVGKIAVVTGASSGIGAGIAKELVKRGCVTIGIGRKLDKLQLVQKELAQIANEAAKGAFYPLQCDITDEQELQEAFVKIEKNHGIPSILVNNAGVSLKKKFKDCDGKVFDATVDTNAKALFLATKLVIKIMTENSVSGHIVNINSIAGHYLPFGEETIVYSGSKHMARIFTEGIREIITEKKLNIKISSISPGLVLTPMIEDFGPYANLYKTALSVDDVVKAFITIVDTGPNVLISELTIMPIHQFTKKLPE